jgi:hypothetical protein
MVSGTATIESVLNAVANLFRRESAADPFFISK